jgi:hypothetical protein
VERFLPLGGAGADASKGYQTVEPEGWPTWGAGADLSIGCARAARGPPPIREDRNGGNGSRTTMIVDPSGMTVSGSQWQCKMTDSPMASSEKDAALAQKLGQLQPVLAASNLHRTAWAMLHLSGCTRT